MPRPRNGLAALGLLALLGSSARGQAIGFDPVVGVANNGVALPATPVVSADRRYVRLTMGPQFSGIEGFSTYSVPAAVSGGPGGPGGLPPRGVLGVAGLDGATIGPGYRMSASRPAPGYSAGDLPFAGLPPDASMFAAQGPLLADAPGNQNGPPPRKATSRKKGRVVRNKPTTGKLPHD